MPWASCPSNRFPAYPVMNSTGKPGRRSRAASAICRPLSPPGRPTSVTNAFTRRFERSTFKAAVPSSASITR